MSPTSVNLLVHGKRAVTSLATAGRLEDALGVPRGTLFRLDQPELVAPYAEEVGAA